MNPAEQARSHVQALLARGVAIADAREPLGVTGVSEIWGGDQPRDRPGWYVWIRQRPGAFALDLEDAGLVAASGSRARAQLSIRYYPSPAAPAFRHFPEPERRIVAGGWLDPTGAPDLRRAGSIPRALFLIGALELEFEDQATQAVSLGAPDRIGDVPAWELARPLFTALVGFVAQSERRSVLRLVETSDVSHRSAVAIFDPAATCPHAIARYVDPEAAILRDEVLTGASASSPPSSDPEPRVPPSWFADGTATPQQIGCCC